MKQAERARPNIIVILTDQMRRDALSCAGDPNVATPNLDRLAAQGVRFTNACSTFPACVPFRFSLMTGEYAHTRNVPALGYRLSPAERTLGDAIKGQGYDTAYIGKWHLYSAYGVSGGMTLSQAARSPVPRSHRRGFDHWQGFELRNDFHDTWVFDGDSSVPRHLPGHQTDVLFDLACDYLAGRARGDDPFFLLLSPEAPHPPFTATPEHFERVRARGPFRPRPNVDVGAIRFFPPEWYTEGGPAGAIDPDDPDSIAPVFEANMQAYYAMIEQIDDRMGDLVATLEREGLAEDTVIVFLSDHGELGGSHGMLGKAEPWEESIGIPLIVAGAGVAPGRLARVPVHSEDLFATLVGLAGARDRPAAPRLDLAPFIRGDAPEPARDGVLLEFVTETRAARAWYEERWRGIRGARYKYLVRGDCTGSRPWCLFDLEADPHEQGDLIDSPAHRDIAKEMHRGLIDLLDASGDDFALAPAFDQPARGAVAL